jgi:hypothetical protein
MKDYMIIGLLIVILMILLSRRHSSYTTAQLSMLTPAIPQSAAQLGKDDIIDIIINQTKGLPVLASVNSLISKVNTAEPSARLVPYTSEAQLSNMFRTAYANSEASLTKTDKAILRFDILFGIEVANLPWGSGGLPTISYTSDGKPVWADEVLGQTGLTIHQGIVKTLEMVKNSPMMDNNLISEINSILPSNLTPFANPADYQTKVASFTDPSIVWFVKFFSIGPLYLLWVAENKWRIDLSWRLGDGGNQPTQL